MEAHFYRLHCASRTKDGRKRHLIREETKRENTLGPSHRVRRVHAARPMRRRIPVHIALRLALHVLFALLVLVAVLA
jgi:hypothetical protein